MLNVPVSPPQASNFAVGHDFTFHLITALLLFFTGAVMVFVIAFAIKYRKGSSASRKGIVHDNERVELIWTVPPVILGLITFGFGAKVFVEARTPPKDAMEIFVVGKRWMWHLQHQTGVRENNTLHVPLGKPVKLTMISQDVIHAFYVPAFRVQYMVIPGRYTTLWFTPTQIGKYPLFCNMYCGTQHSEMGGYVYVMDPKDYASWLARGGEAKKPGMQTLAHQGEALYKKLNCGNCHTETDTDRGPTLYGIAGSKRPLRNNASAVADDSYLRESIVQKDLKFTAGYQDTMPSYKELSEEDVRLLVEYIKSLGTVQPPTSTSTPPPAAGAQEFPKQNPGGTENTRL